MTYSNQYNCKNIPRTDKNGRDLYSVKLTDGMNFKTIYIFSYSAEGAIEKARAAQPYHRLSRCRKCDPLGDKE